MTLDNKATLAYLDPRDIYEHMQQWDKITSSLPGSQHSPLKHVSRLPESSRQYVSGDPIRLIDWKAYARLDQLIVREEVAEARAKIALWCSIAQSMQWSDALVCKELNLRVPSKLELAIRMLFHLAALHMHKGDEVWLWVLDPQAHAVAFRPRDLGTLYALFEQIQAQNFVFDFAHVFKDGLGLEASSYHHQYVMSDFLDQASLDWIQTASRQVSVLQILSSLEQNLTPWVHDSSCYVPRLSSEETSLQHYGKDLRMYYDQALKTWLEGIKQRTQRQGASYSQWTDRSLLSHYFESIRHG